MKIRRKLSKDMKKFSKNLNNVFEILNSMTGSKVFESSVFNWDGKDFDGKDLASGTYYFTADVIYDILDKENDQKQIKGWVQILK